MDTKPVSPTNQKQVEDGQAVYTKSTLSIYDIVVLGISNRFIWKCATQNILAHYNKHLSNNHLDVGVGTGYFMDKSTFPSTMPRIGLMDMNANTLEFASKRIQRYQPETYQQNILEPVTQEITHFDSLGINYLFHCVPGTIAEKAIAFDHLKPFLNPDATVFGSTILQGDVPRSAMAKWLMSVYNKKGIFHNTQDTLEELQQALESRFTDVSIDVIGCVALFSARFQ